MQQKVISFLVILNISFLVIFQAGCATPVEVKGEAMYPTFNEGDKIVLDESAKDFARGDIIVFGSPKDTKRLLIMRIVGLPGEKIEIKENKTYINGVLTEEPYIQPVHNQFIQSFPETAIPAGRYYVMGDNRDSSADSRHWGTIGIGLIKENTPQHIAKLNRCRSLARH